MFLQATLMKLTGRHTQTQAHTQACMHACARSHTDTRTHRGNTWKEERLTCHLVGGQKEVMGGEYDQNIYMYEMPQ